MSTLRVDNIQDNGSGFNDVVSFQNVNGTENGKLCRAFVNFNGQGAVAIRANFNVNSITDNGTGDYTANFGNSLSDANYSAVGNIDDGVVKVGTRASGTYRFHTQFLNGAAADMGTVCIAIFR